MRLRSLIGDDLLSRMRAEAQKAPPGCFVEVGVYHGGSAQVLYELAMEQWRDLYLYDTFDGMPFAEDFDNHRIGDFADCSAADIKAALPLAHVIKGVFPASLVDMPPIAFVHADADQYQSTKDVCAEFGRRMVRGGSILFDDYRGVVGCIKAVDECFPGREVWPDGRALVRF